MSKTESHHNLTIYPSTPHLVGSNLQPGDVEVNTYDPILQSRTIIIEEKLDGANARVSWDGNPKTVPLIGNREKTLSKAYTRKDTPAKLQFRPLWGWVYEHREEFADLTARLGETPVVFGEWLFAEHTIHYNQIWNKFQVIAIKVESGFLDPKWVRTLCEVSGFETPPLIDIPFRQLQSNFNGYITQSYYTTDPKVFMEGFYIKTGDGKYTTGRYKWVRPDFTPITDFNERGLRLNTRTVLGS